ncbi:Flp pilus assembly protein TadG [Thalassobacillus cyri]|uniref:Flp pilus assembly protein TadG n=1 Tax=Thalassobacillus cyri TaxID=571932 RepID=A0A1H4EFH3_9BACI|nr:Flp pilus assembly protein TadG [Thalassobacillus cyri]
MVRKEEGQSLVEFALVLPVLLLLVVGIFDFGRVLYTHLQMELVAQEAVRLGGLGQGETAVKEYAHNHFQAANPEGLEVLVTVSSRDGTSTGEWKSGNYVTVTMSYPEEILQPLGGASIPYTVKTSSTIRIE